MRRLTGFATDAAVQEVEVYEKLIIACAAVLVLGLGLTTIGHVLGGQFYSVYYDGALHPFSDAAQNFPIVCEHQRPHCHRR